MANLTVTWVLPTTRESGKPLAPADIAGVEIELSADAGQTWGTVGTYPPATLSTVIQDVDFGEWHVRGTVVDTKDRRSQPTLGTIVNEDTTPPSALTLELALS